MGLVFSGPPVPEELKVHGHSLISQDGDGRS